MYSFSFHSFEFTKEEKKKTNPFGIVEIVHTLGRCLFFAPYLSDSFRFTRRKMPVKYVHYFDIIQIGKLRHTHFFVVAVCCMQLLAIFHSWLYHTFRGFFLHQLYLVHVQFRQIHTSRHLSVGCCHWCRLFLMFQICRRHTFDQMQRFLDGPKIFVLLGFFPALLGALALVVVRISHILVTYPNIFHCHHSSIIIFFLSLSFLSIITCLCVEQYCFG